MFDANDTPCDLNLYVHFFRSQINLSRFYLKNTKLQCCLMWRFAIFKLKSVETYWFTQPIHNGSNTARLNLKIDRFQVNNEYSRDGMRTEQIHIGILNHISHTCKIMCTKKKNSAEGWKYWKRKHIEMIVLLNVSKFCL
jgi:hypothetical protein